MLHRHPVLTAITVLYLGAVGWITLGPAPYDDRTGSLVHRLLAYFSDHSATHWITFDRLEFAANIAMFVPVGLFFVLLSGRRLWWLAALVACSFSVGIELFQGAFLSTRVSDPRDVLANSIGAILGVVAGIVLTAITDFSRRHRVSRGGTRAVDPV